MTQIVIIAGRKRLSSSLEALRTWGEGRKRWDFRNPTTGWCLLSTYEMSSFGRLSPYRMSLCVCVYAGPCVSLVQLFVTPWTVAHQAPPSMGFSRQECWSGLPFPSPGDHPDPGIQPGSHALNKKDFSQPDIEERLGTTGIPEGDGLWILIKALF